MKDIAKLHQHQHTKFGSQDAYGYRLEAGDELKPTDIYASTDGTWQECPCPGVTLGSNEVVWVRPAPPFLP